MILPGASVEIATVVAQRLRICVQDTPLATVGAITVSLGVAHWQANSGSLPAEVLSEADAALYVAKQNGRNQVQVARSGVAAHS